jgi:hypothetical protein
MAEGHQTRHVIVGIDAVSLQIAAHQTWHFVVGVVAFGLQVVAHKIGRGCPGSFP